jgi:DNA repair protein RadC
MSDRIQDMPEADRPRERLLRLGAETLSDAELLGIFINTGIPGENAVQIGQRLLRENGGLLQLSRRSGKSLERVKGLGPAKAAVLGAAFELGRRAARQVFDAQPMTDPESIYELMKLEVQALNHEELHVLVLNAKFGLIRRERVFRGGLAETPAFLREIFKVAIEHSAYAIVVVHNHPSGDPTPSASDRRFTSDMVHAGRLLKIPLADHVIIGHAGENRPRAYFSFRESGLIVEP